MSKIDELAALIAGVAGKIDETTGDSSSVAQEAEEAAATAEALGAAHLVEGLSLVKEQLESLAEMLRGASQHATDVQALVLSLAEGA